jgi:hypothetical protein
MNKQTYPHYIKTLWIAVGKIQLFHFQGIDAAYH